MNSKQNSRIYLDYAATTPLDERVRAAMDAVREDGAFNPSSPHAEGRRARAVLERARDRVARVLNAPRRSIAFTAGGTESNNLAIFGTARAATARRHVVVSAIEHHSVSRVADELESQGFSVTRVPVDSRGQVDVAAFASALRADTLIASVMYANNEIGAVQPIRELSAAARSRGALFHTDAVAGAGWLPLDTAALGVDLLSLSAHKFYGPRGAGVLYVREGTPLSPMLFGGGQESGRRSGTEDVVAAAGLAEALALAESERAATSARVGPLRDALERAVLDAVAGARANGAGAPRLPDITSITFPDRDPAAFLMLLDLEGIAASAGSACTSGSLEPSHVIAALDPGTRGATIRFSLGRATKLSEVERVARLLPGIAASAGITA
ncbi:MAG TPA: cysteine desulfurase family protein [Candidatus Tumulicola sp.]